MCQDGTRKQCILPFAIELTESISKSEKGKRPNGMLSKIHCQNSLTVHLMRLQLERVFEICQDGTGKQCILPFAIELTESISKYENCKRPNGMLSKIHCQNSLTVHLMRLHLKWVFEICQDGTGKQCILPFAI